MDELIQAMSISELRKFRNQYKDNASVCKIVDGYIEIKVKEEAREAIRLQYMEAVALHLANFPKLSRDLDLSEWDYKALYQRYMDFFPHVPSVNNLYSGWREVEVEDTTQEPEVVEIVDEIEVVDDKGHITTPAVTHTEPRYPTTKVSQWVVELNKGFAVAKSGGGNAKPGLNKQAITIWKRSGTELQEVGKYRSGAEGCRTLGILCVGDNPIRVLGREGYLVERFDGTFGELAKQ